MFRDVELVWLAALVACYLVHKFIVRSVCPALLFSLAPYRDRGEAVDKADTGFIQTEENTRV